MKFRRRNYSSAVFIISCSVDYSGFCFAGYFGFADCFDSDYAAGFCSDSDNPY